MAPSIEIALPFYGGLDYLQQSVLSITAQTDPDWVLRIYDDNVPADPATRAWLDGLDDARVTYRTNERNLGAAGNYNQCLDRAEADFLVVMGHDDRMLPEYVAAARAALDAAPSDVVVYQPRVRVIDADGRPSRPLGDRVKGWVQPPVDGLTTLRGEALARSLMTGNWTYFPAMVWRTATVTAAGFHADSSIVQDARLLLDLVMAGGAVLLDPATTFEYRRHASASSASSLATGVRFAEERAFYEEYARRLDALGWARAARAARRRATSRLNGALVAASETRRGRPARGLRLVREHVLSR